MKTKLVDQLYSSATIVLAVILMGWTSSAMASGTSYEAMVNQAAGQIAQSTAMDTPQRIEQIQIQARNIVNQMAGDEDFTSSCGMYWDCDQFWMDQISNMIAQALQSAEQERLARCAAVKAEWAEKDCSARRHTRPNDDFSINFNFPSLIFDYNFLRPGVRAFHQALWDDLSGDTWSNFLTFGTRMKELCSQNIYGLEAIRTVLVAQCTLSVDHYFGQIGGAGFAGYSNSQAASDASSSRFGQACRNIAQRSAADSCQ